MMRTILTGLIRVYRLAISPVLPPSCRFYPSCSEYGIEAIQRHGALRGGILAACRVGRCHPWNDGGVDEVPVETPSLRSLCLCRAHRASPRVQEQRAMGTSMNRVADAADASGPVR
ncbi:MAG: membrane protein insertion efficiency factor YidD [Burkholderiaceae bacterium]|nr:membrane protein insertion efficiency factor YidD [Burkholderiaceae bacterium]